MPEETAKTRRKAGVAAQTAAKRSTGAAGRVKRTAGQTNPDATVHELIVLVSRVAAGFEATLKTKTPALSLSQWTMLEMLSQDDGTARPSQVARKLGFSRQLVRQATKKLVSLELVAKEAPEEGKKAVGLMISAAGRTALADIATSTDAMSETLKADKRGGGINQAVRTLKGLSATIPTTAPASGKGRKKKGEASQTASTEE